MFVRAYLTRWLWFQDRLCSFPPIILLGVVCLCLSGLFVLGSGGVGFIDDLAYLIAENDLRTGLIVIELLVAAGSVLWVLFCCLWALVRRFLLYMRGL